MSAASPWWDRDVHRDRRPFLMGRSRIIGSLRGWFAARDFVEVEAAILQVSPGNETHLHGFATQLLTPAGERRPLPRWWLRLPVEVTDAIRPGVVSLPHGWGHDQPETRLRVAAERAGVNSNILADHEALDPLSGTSVLNGIPVDVAPVPA